MRVVTSYFIREMTQGTRKVQELLLGMTETSFCKIQRYFCSCESMSSAASQ